MAMFPDDIKDIQGMDLQKQVLTLYNYIRYMKEQLDFYSGARAKETAALKEGIDDINKELGKIDDWMTDKDIHVDTIENATSNSYGFINTDIYLRDGEILLGAATTTQASIQTILLPVLYPYAGGNGIYGRWMIAVCDETMSMVPLTNIGTLKIYYTKM